MASADIASHQRSLARFNFNLMPYNHLWQQPNFLLELAAMNGVSVN